MGIGVGIAEFDDFIILMVVVEVVKCLVLVGVVVLEVVLIVDVTVLVKTMDQQKCRLWISARCLLSCQWL